MSITQVDVQNHEPLGNICINLTHVKYLYDTNIEWQLCTAQQCVEEVYFCLTLNMCSFPDNEKDKVPP